MCDMWNVRMSSSDRIFYSLHTLASIIGEDNALQLPAAHSLTGCDTVRSSRPEMFCKKGVLKNFAIFTGKQLCQRLFFNKVAGATCNFIKKETLAQVFSCEFCEIFKNTFFIEHPWWLLLTVSNACYTDSSPKYYSRKFYSCSTNRGYDTSGRKFSCEYNQACPKQNKNIQ